MTPGSKEIGRRLRAAREAPPRWSRSEMARRLRAAADPDEQARLPHVASLVDQIKQWEAGKWAPSARYRDLYVRATGRPWAELFADARTEPTSLWRHDGLDGALSPDDEERLVLAAARPARLDAGALDALAAILAGQRRLEDSIGSAPLIASTRAQLDVVEALVDGARGPVRRAAVDIASQWAQFAAWLHASSRRLAEADRLYDRAIVWAIEADVPDMAATAWNMKGHAAWIRGAIGPMIGLSQVAGRDRRASPGVRALAAQQEARGHAITGDLDGMERQLDVAHELTVEAADRPDGEPPWIYFFDTDMLTLQRARAYLYVPDRVGDAAELLEAGLSRVPADRRRSEWLAHYLADLAQAYRALHEDGEADRTLEEVGEVAAVTGSDVLAQRVATLR